MKFAKIGEKTPHVCFKYEAPSSSGSDDELPQRLVSELRDRFSSVRMLKIWIGGSWSLILGAGAESHTAGFAKSRFCKGEWILAVTAARSAGLLESQVLDVCRRIHESLIAICGITRVRWYFEGPKNQKGTKNQSPAVATPDELPWPSA